MLARHSKREQVIPARRVDRHDAAGALPDRLGDHEVSSRLDGGIDGSVGQRREHEQSRSILRERHDRGCEAFLGEHRREDPAREVAQLAEGSAQLRLRPVDALEQLRIALGVEPRARETQSERNSDEMLLRAVVEVALEAAPLGIAVRD